GRSGDRAGRIGRQGECANRHALRRRAPAPVFRARRLRRSRCALPGRADRRHGRGRPPSGAREHPRALRGRQDDRAHHPRSRGGVSEPHAPSMTRPAAAPFPQMLLAQTKSELLMRWRVPAFSVTNLALPIVFFTFFGLPVAHVVRGDGVSIGAYLLASFGAYAVGNVMVYGFGIGVANERGMKVDRLMRASPLPPLVFMLAKVVTALVFAFLALVLLI